MCCRYHATPRTFAKVCVEPSAPACRRLQAEIAQLKHSLLEAQAVAQARSSGKPAKPVKPASEKAKPATVVAPAPSAAEIIAAVASRTVSPTPKQEVSGQYGLMNPSYVRCFTTRSVTPKVDSFGL